MPPSQTVNVADYMNGSIRAIMAKAYKNVLSNPREARFAWQMRKRLEQRGITVSERSFSCKGSMGPVHAGHPNEKDLSDLKAFARACTAL